MNESVLPWLSGLGASYSQFTIIQLFLFIDDSIVIVRAIVKSAECKCEWFESSSSFSRGNTMFKLKTHRGHVDIVSLL